MPYTAERPPARETADQLRARIPGWGADADPKDRPSYPRERRDLEPTGAHWDFPERQPELYPRERSVEHGMLTPVFGTVLPPKGVSGAIRRLSYRRYSEGRAAHWLLLVLADRVDAAGSHLRSLGTRRPDNPFTETGIRSEFTNGGFRSRWRRGRADVKHMWMDPILVAGPWVLGAVVLARVIAKARSKRG
jgi:hypothetical protein